jgi:hypothetical protein
MPPPKSKPPLKFLIGIETDRSRPEARPRCHDTRRTAKFSVISVCSRISCTQSTEPEPYRAGGLQAELSHKSRRLEKYPTGTVLP